MKISIKTISIFWFIIFIIIISYLFFMVKNEEVSDIAAGNINYEKTDEVIFNVKIGKVIRGNFVKTVSANGLVKASKELNVVSNINGFIKEINIYEGKEIKEGDLLVKLDDREYLIVLNEAEVNVSNAKIEYGFLSKDMTTISLNNEADSVKNLIFKLEEDFNDGRISENDFIRKKEELDLALIFTGAKRDEVILNKSGLTNAINSLNRARLNLSYTEITAPFSGVIADCNLVRKQRIIAGETLFRILDIKSFRIEVGVLENELVNIKVGNKAEINLNALQNKKYSGRIVSINPLIDKETKTCRVTIEIPNSDKLIKSGMFASVNIESDILKDRILIPKKALLVRDGRNLVFVLEKNQAKWRYVQIGKENNEYIEILNGVSEGSEIIIEGHYNLAHDSKVQINN